MPRSAALLCFAIAASIAFVGCGRLTATREFNHGVRYYKDKSYAAAARAFERASQSIAHPEVRYNLALSRYQALRSTKDRSPADAQAALEAIASALEAAKSSDSMQTRLHYLAGAVHQLENHASKARAAYNASLEIDPNYAPSLKALVELDPTSNSPLTKLVLATTKTEPPPLEEKLPL
jgi:tetratricopeptide (TPR) repeat protein